jgi:N-methylhydantoinase A/oxoprolinase/acetone carboxylase beta subunit
VAERLRADGSAEIPLDEAQLPALLRQIELLGAETLAISLLHAYANPTHESRLATLIRAARPDLPISLSSDISPEIREYERCSTTVLNALLMPVVKAYLDRLEERLGEDGFSPLVFLVQSNGGVCSLRMAAEQPARLLLSGPSGGALAAGRISEMLSRPNLVAVDMGGTSYDVSVVQSGRVSVITQGEIDRLPVRLPMVEMRTIGAGGGSIGSVDAAGRLTVGPRSAGARPGPVAYGRGGTEPTVTDANLALGRLDPDFFLGGAIKLDMPATRSAIETRIAAPLQLSVEQAAAGILTVTNANLGAAVRLSLFEKGLDPRDFALLSFGGAGGLHATEVAEEMGISEVIFPREPGTLSAYGILFSDLVQDLARTKLTRAETASLPQMREFIAELREAADARLAQDGIPPDQRNITIAADMRYQGQAFELLVPWGQVVSPDVAALAELAHRFHATHKQRFSYANPDEAVEIVTFRAIATGNLAKPVLREPTPAARPAHKAKRRAFDGTQWCEVTVWDREALGQHDVIQGPAIVEEAFATHWISPAWQARLAPGGALIAKRITP